VIGRPQRQQHQQGVELQQQEEKNRPRNDLYCVGWGVKLYSFTPARKKSTFMVSCKVMHDNISQTLAVRITLLEDAVYRAESKLEHNH